MSSANPTILFLHGAYHPPACYESVTSRLVSAGFEVVTPKLASLGEGAVGITTNDDVNVVRREADALLDSGKNIVLVGHSYGGFVSMVSATYLTSGISRKKGVLKGIVYLSAILTKEGGLAADACNPTHASSPDREEVFEIQTIEGKLSASLKHSETTIRYYHSPAPREDIEKTLALLEPQCPDVFYLPSPVSPSDITVPQTYIIAEQDYLVLLEAQEKIVAEAGGKIKPVRLGGAGHAAFLTHFKEITNVIIETAST